MAPRALRSKKRAHADADADAKAYADADADAKARAPGAATTRKTEEESDDTFFSDDESKVTTEPDSFFDDGEARAGKVFAAKRKMSSTKTKPKTSTDLVGSMVVDDRFRGGVLGLLVMSRKGGVVEEDGSIDGRAARELRLAQSSYVSAATSVANDDGPASHVTRRRLPPIVSIACIDATKRMYADPKDLASAVVDALAATSSSECGRWVVESLPDHLLRIQDAKRKFGKNVADGVIRRQIWEMDARFSDEREESLSFRPVDSIGVEVVSACTVDGWIAAQGKTHANTRSIPTSIFKRMIGPYGRVYDGDRVHVRNDRKVLIDRLSWAKALRSATLPALRQNDVLLLDAVRRPVFVIGGKTLVEPVVGAKMCGSVRAALMVNGAVDIREDATFQELVKEIQTLVQVAEKEKEKGAALNDDDVDDDGENTAAIVDQRRINGIRELSAYVSDLAKGNTRSAASIDIEKDDATQVAGAGAGAGAGAADLVSPCDLPEMPGQYDRSLSDWLRVGWKTSDSEGGKVDVTSAQGHVISAGPVLTPSPESTAPRVHVYDHVRSVDPMAACLTFASAKIREGRKRALSETESAITESAQRRATESGVFPDVRASMFAYTIAYDRIRLPLRERLGGSATSEAARIATELASVEAQDEIDYDGLLALGISDAGFYSAQQQQQLVPFSGAKDRPEDFLFVRGAMRLFSPREILSELAASLGISPPLGVTEERAVLDGFEYHMPSGEGEHARQLRRRIAEIRRRRAEIMAKADTSGKQYDAVERKLMDRLRSEAAPKMLTEAITGMCAVLSAVILVDNPERIAASPSGALSACLASMRRAHNDGDKVAMLDKSRRRRLRPQNKKNGGGGVEVDVLDLLSCAAAGLLAGRLPPPTPTEIDLRPEIEAAERSVDAELPKRSGRDGVISGMIATASRHPEHSAGTPSDIPRDFRPSRVQPISGSRSAPGGLRMSTASTLMSVLWEHVRDAHGATRLRVQNQVIGVRSAVACCAYVVTDPGDETETGTGTGTGTRSRWQALATESDDVDVAIRASEAARAVEDAGESAHVLGGIPSAASLRIVGVDGRVSAEGDKKDDGVFVISQREVVVIDAPAGPPDAPSEFVGVAEDVEKTLAALRGLNTTIRDELSSTDSAADLETETQHRFEALLKSIGMDDDDVTAASAAAAAPGAEDVFSVMFPTNVSDDSGGLITLGYVKAELGPALTRLGASARVSEALAADLDLAPIAAAAAMSMDVESSVRWRARCRELAGVCSTVSSYLAGEAAGSYSSMYSYAAVFVLWALTRSSSSSSTDADVGMRAAGSSDVGVRAARVMFSRLADRVAFNRRDRLALEQVALQQKMEDARARARAAVENLSDEQREILRERRRIGRVDDVESAVGEGVVSPPGLDERDSDSDSALNGEAGMVDAIDMYATE